MFTKGDGLDLMKDQKAYVFTGQTPKLSALNKMSMSTKRQHLILRGKIVRDLSKRTLTYLAIVYPPKLLHHRQITCPLPSLLIPIFHMPRSLSNPIWMKTLLKHTQNVFENQHNASKTFLKALLNPPSYHLVFNYQPNLKIMKTYL
jgi:hypothetical protein